MTSCFEVSDGIAYLTASIIGANHRALLLPNQDHAKYKYSTDSFMLVVSDGVGSCSKSELGSEYACAAAVEVFDELLDEKLEYDFDCILPALIYKWRDRIGDDNPDDYCATMKIAIKHEGIIKLISLGDGELIVSSAGNRVKAPNEHEFFSNITHCLNNQTAAADFWTKDFRLDIQTDYVVMACSDGVSNGMEHGTELEFAEEIEKNISIDELENEIKHFLQSLENSSFDDKTIGVIKYGR